MASIKIPNYRTKTVKGRLFGYWEATRKMKALGFTNVPCGPDGPEAWAKAQRFDRKWQLARRGLPEGPQPKAYPAGSFGDAFARFRKTAEWAGKAPRTREEWIRAWDKIEPLFGDVAPTSVDFETMDQFYADPKIGLLSRHGVREAHRIIKVWRAFWRVAAAMQLCERYADPSLGIRRKTPTPRSAIWREGEVVRLAKSAMRRGYPGLACVIAVAWDTQFSPVDVRGLTLERLEKRASGWRFRVARAKTKAAAIGTLSRRTERLLDGYLKSLGAELLPTAPIFRNRSGRPYSKDTLGDDFRDVRVAIAADESRTLADLRRSGTVEAFAGGASPSDVSAKMANDINTSAALQRTYNPVELTAVRQADQARRLGRARMRENEQ